MIIRAENVSKIYPERQGPRVFFGRGGVGEWLGRKPRAEFAALRDITLEVKAGESLGIIGSNGSGKSTLLKILAGVTLPSSGDVVVSGKVASLLELGAGFHPMLTGRENIYLNASIYGMRRQDVDAIMDDIIAFSGIGPFIDKPVDTYSSGMYVRIAFSVAVHVNPDIFLVDEVLAVGDEEFQRKCRRKIGELREQGKTILFVSHDLGIVNTVCQRVILLSRGELLERGTPQKTFDYYLRQIGSAGGVHRLVSGDHEALFSNGKLSLYAAGVELTASEGVLALVESLGQVQGSPLAEWTLLRADDTSMLAEGSLARVPARLRLELTLVEGKLRCSLSLLAEQDFSLESLSLVIPVPALLDRWSFDGESLIPAAITPGHVHDEPAAMPDSVSREVVAYAAGDDLAVAFSLHVEPVAPAYLHLMNGDFLSGARRLFWTYRPMPSERAVKKGDAIALGAVKFDLGLNSVMAKNRAIEREASRQCVSASVRAHLGRGCVRFETTQGIPVGELQVLLCYGGLWTNSTFLAASPVVQVGESLRIVSHSSRLPLDLIWTLRPDGDGIRVDATVEVKDALALQECNFSFLLPSAYTHWQTEAESVVYPDFQAEQAWQPLPTRYLPANTIRLLGEGVPTVAFRAEHEPTTLLPSALNTGAVQGCRVAQWIRRESGSDAIYLDAGTHPLLSAIIRVEAE